jgi:hypothetical protein
MGFRGIRGKIYCSLRPEAEMIKCLGKGRQGFLRKVKFENGKSLRVHLACFWKVLKSSFANFMNNRVKVLTAASLFIS